MLTLLDLPSDIINIAICLSNLDKKMLKSTCTILYKIMPVSHVFYDDPINSPFSANQLRLLISPECVKNDGALLLAKNSIKRSRLDLLQLLMPFTEDYDFRYWRITAAQIGNLEVYKHTYHLKAPTSMDDDALHALASGHVHIFDYLENNYKTRRDEHGLTASVGAIMSGKLEIVMDIYKREYMFGQQCMSHANNLDVIKWLYDKGFTIIFSTIDEMAKRGDLAAIKWFDEMKVFPKEKLFGYCLSARFVDGMKYLLNNGCSPTKRQLDGYENLVINKARPWYEWLNKKFGH